jgi:hypothetical protein
MSATPRSELFNQSGPNVWSTEGTGGKADGATESFVEVWQTFIKIDVPASLAADHNFLLLDPVRRAGINTDSTVDAKLVATKWVGRIGD